MQRQAQGKSLLSLTLSLISLISAISPAIAAPPRTPDKEENCDILVVGGGLSGAATAYESLLAGRTVCLTEITDWGRRANFLPRYLCT